MFSIKAGDIRLQVNNRKDYFFAQQVETFEALPDYETLIGVETIGFNDKNFSTKGMKTYYKNVCLDRKDTIIRGYYADTMPQQRIFTPYEVNIYLRYEEEPEQEHIIPTKTNCEK